VKHSNSFAAFAMFALGACSVSPAEESAQASSELQVAVGPSSLSFEFAHSDAIIPAGIAAGADVFFVGSPLEGRVMVHSRRSGRVIAELPQPPANFVLPLIIRSIGANRIAVLDSGGFPSPGVLDAEPTLHEYEYSFRRGSFQAELVRTVRFTGNRIGFAEGLAHLGSGRYLLTDAVYGSLWRVTSDGQVRPGIVPKTFAAEDAIPELSFCRTMPEVLVGGLPFLFTGSTIPGVAGIAVRDGTIYLYSSCAGALYRLPLATLFDSRLPWQRAADIRLIAAKHADVAVEELLEMQFNPFERSDRYLYAADALQLRLIRIDPRTGARQVVADDPRLFNFPSALGFVPPKAGEPSALLVLSNQQHRNPLTNEAIDQDSTERPYIVTKVLLKPERRRSD
jgi:hypothetical protein